MQKEPKDHHNQAVDQLVPLFDVLCSLPYMTNLYLQMQCRNISITDYQLNLMEEQLLKHHFNEHGTPLIDAFVVSAWSQLWVFGFFELMRTWRAFVRDNLKFARAILETKDLAARQAVIDKKIVKNDKASRLTIDFGADRRAAMSGVITLPERGIELLQPALDRTNSLFRMLNDVRSSLAKHQVAGTSAHAPSPGYGRINPLNGSISWRIVYDEPRSERMMSRRDIADQCRISLSSLSAG